MELYALNDIADLSLYAIDVATSVNSYTSTAHSDILNNVSLSKGSYYYVFYQDSYFEFFVSCDVDEKDGRLYMDDKIAKPLIHGHPSLTLSTIKGSLV